MNVRIRDAGPADQEFLARGNEAMALETEHKRLDPRTIRRGVAAVLENPAYGRYFVAEDDAGRRPSASSWSPTNGATGAVASSGGSRACTCCRRHGVRGVFRALYDHIDSSVAARPA
jgi:hypothetical protein